MIKIELPTLNIIKHYAEGEYPRECCGLLIGRIEEALQRAGFTGRLVNLTGGITAWSNEVDASVPKY